MLKNKIKGWFLITAGYILSPLSWWNDLFINIPLAYIFAIPFGAISKTLFMPMLIVGYWITNIIGFMLMHHGTKSLSTKKNKKYTRKELVKDLTISILYTILILILILKGWLRFPTEYFVS